MVHDKILILDFGSQYTQLIARRIRELQVYCEIWPYTTTVDAIKDFNPNGIILSGGPASVHGSDIRAPDSIFEMALPILGICYGMQTMTTQLGGQVEAAQHSEYGQTELQLIAQSALFAGMACETLSVWMSHGDKVTAIPESFDIIGQSASAPIAAIAHQSKPFYGLQFHPEVTHTEQGNRLLQNFVRGICGCKPTWTPGHIITDCIQHIREQVGDQQVLLALSGGVDSSVVAAMLHEAIGAQLTCIFVDTGLLRQNEPEQVMATFAEHMGVKVKKVSAKARFFEALKSVDDPEAKRKIIGKLFIDIFEEESKKLNDIQWLAQGTIYPDVVESAANATGTSTVIKSHHNVGGLPDTMHLKLLEPIRDLFKDEVRLAGIELGLPRSMVYRHPFPGPGLAVRIMGAVSESAANIVRQADAIFIEELRQSGWYDKVAQAFAVFLPVNSVGVVGDHRTYAPVIALRAVSTTDFMTATWSELPYDLIAKVSNRIVNEVKTVSRVVYDVTTKPPATIEWE